MLPFHLQKKLVEIQLLHRTKFMFRYLTARDSEKSSFNFFIFISREKNNEVERVKLPIAECLSGLSVYSQVFVHMKLSRKPWK